LIYVSSLFESAAAAAMNNAHAKMTKVYFIVDVC
jgi:hypothetical protein